MTLSFTLNPSFPANTYVFRDDVNNITICLYNNEQFNPTWYMASMPRKNGATSYPDRHAAERAASALYETLLAERRSTMSPTSGEEQETETTDPNKTPTQPPIPDPDPADEFEDEADEDGEDYEDDDEEE